MFDFLQYVIYLLFVFSGSTHVHRKLILSEIELKQVWLAFFGRNLFPVEIAGVAPCQRKRAYVFGIARVGDSVVAYRQVIGLSCFNSGRCARDDECDE